MKLGGTKLGPPFQGKKPDRRPSVSPKGKLSRLSLQAWHFVFGDPSSGGATKAVDILFEIESLVSNWRGAAEKSSVKELIGVG